MPFSPVYRIGLAITLTVLSVVIFLSCIFMALIVTPIGGKFLVSYVIRQGAGVAAISLSSCEGSINNGLVLKDLYVENSPRWPRARMHIQEMRVRISWWDWRQSLIELSNARILIPQSDPIILRGKMINGVFDGGVYSKSIDVHELLLPLPDQDVNKYLTGSVSDVDLTIKGTIYDLAVAGRLTVDKIKFQATTVSEGYGKIDVHMDVTKNPAFVRGEVSMSSGLVKTRKVNIELNPSKVMYEGDYRNPKLAIYGVSQIDSMTINSVFKGTLEKPQLQLDSDPPLPQEILMLVLATGKTWSASSKSASQGVLSGQLVGDFIDYFFLGGKGGELVGELGLSDINVQYDDSNKKVEGGVTVDKNWSLNVSQKVDSRSSNAPSSTQNPSNENTLEKEIYLKYKKSF